ncbi:hypothetical protein [Kitasatospora viridis]|uniref:DUF4375 domain-containing protein n=1 Tax=Kitasatospora viridis TaxID=281105 RepID=A0A561SFH4_9ACTN|nr:hypothetical protein [Kitasatospora viridis]TWF73558.1 hypothetical protein FHX73_15171 [Kitasatospora viridis]
MTLTVPLVPITATELDSLTPDRLLARSVSLIIRQFAVAGPERSKEIVAGLDPVRGALFGYWVLHTHGGNALTGFCAELPHRTVDPDFWALTERSLLALGDGPLLEVFRRFQREISRAQSAYRASTPVRGDWDGTTTGRMLDLLDRTAMRELDTAYRAAVPDSLARLGAYIRRNGTALFDVAA